MRSLGLTCCKLNGGGESKREFVSNDFLLALFRFVYVYVA